MKTPEELAKEWMIEEYGDISRWLPMGIEMSFDAFLAGYKAAQPQWISVKEQMPEPGQKVLALGRDKNVIQLKLRKNHDKDLFGNWEYISGFDQDVNGCLVIDVTHWIPLPKPLKEE